MASTQERPGIDDVDSTTFHVCGTIKDLGKILFSLAIRRRIPLYRDKPLEVWDTLASAIRSCPDIGTSRMLTLEIKIANEDLLPLVMQGHAVRCLEPMVGLRLTPEAHILSRMRCTLASIESED